MTTTQLSAEQKALVKRLDQELVRSRQSAALPSEYFLDKCSSEVGDFSEARQPAPQREARTPWAVLVDSTWFGRLRKH